jgi:tetratricopeptide (TPR) repeat protein
LDAALKAIDIYPEQVAAVTNAGVAYQRLGEFQRSIAMYRRGLQLDPHNNKIYGYLGQAYFAWSNAILTGDFAVRAVRLEALDNLMTAVRLGFHAPSMLHMIGTILLDLGRLDEAISYYDSAIRRSAELRSYYRNSKDVPAEDDIDAAGTYNQLGQAFSALANHTMAISMFKEGLKLQPHNIPVISNLGSHGIMK